MSKLLKLKKWLTLEDAANHISKKLDETITIADLYRLALDGHLKLSLYFVNSAYGVEGKLRKSDDVNKSKSQKCFDITDGTVQPISGIWDLTMQGKEALEVEGYFEENTSGVRVKTPSNNGILLQQGDVICELYTYLDREYLFSPKYNESEERKRAIAEEPMKALENSPSIITPLIKKNKLGVEFIPCKQLSEAESVLIIKSSEIHLLLKSLEDVPIAEKLLTSNERNSLLVLIAALCEQANIDWNKRGATKTLAPMTDLLGSPLSDDTIRKILKQLDPAISSRSV